MSVLFKIALSCLGGSIISGGLHSISSGLIDISWLMDDILLYLHILLASAAIVFAIIGLWYI